jgi:hypothetical protein
VCDTGGGKRTAWHDDRDESRLQAEVGILTAHNTPISVVSLALCCGIRKNEIKNEHRSRLTSRERFWSH